MSLRDKDMCLSPPEGQKLQIEPGPAEKSAPPQSLCLWDVV